MDGGEEEDEVIEEVPDSDGPSHGIEEAPPLPASFSTKDGTPPARSAKLVRPPSDMLARERHTQHTHART